MLRLEVTNKYSSDSISIQKLGLNAPVTPKHNKYDFCKLLESSVVVTGIEKNRKVNFQVTAYAICSLEFVTGMSIYLAQANTQGSNSPVSIFLMNYISVKNVC